MPHAIIHELRELSERFIGHPTSKRLVLTAAELIQKLEQELTEMRTFIDAASILVAHDTATTAALATANTQIGTLTAELTAAQANAQTPDVLAAQASVIAQAEVISPEVVASGTNVTGTTIPV